MNPRLGFLALALTLLTRAAAVKAAVEAGAAQNPRADFVSIEDAVPGIIVEMRYAGFHNFTGRPVTGYDAPKCLLTRQAARALASVEADAKKRSLTLKVYDCYRPQKAVDDFIAWAKQLKDRTMKAEFYPHVAKKDLFRDGYIAARSAHSRGSTMDLTLVPLPIPKEAAYREGEKLHPCTAPVGRRFADNSIDMGTGFDCFDPLAHTDNPAVGPRALANRRLLRSLMARHGFKNLPEEWWHFTLKREPFPRRYFDFDVR